MFAVQIGSGPYNDQIVILYSDGSFGHYLPSFEDVGHYDPSWSPDGERIAFSLDSHIAVARPDGSELTQLTGGYDERAPKWSPDQTRIVYQSFDISHDTYDLFVMNADGSAQTDLTKDPAQDTNGEWSPDGARIAFTSDRDGAVMDQFGLYVMDPDGSRVTSVGPLKPWWCGPGRFGAWWKPPYSWSPDSRRIAFATCVGGEGEIVSSAVGGTMIRNLTRNTADDVEPVWAPDGRIAFASNRDNVGPCGPDCNYEIYVMDSDGGHVTRLTNDPEGSVPLLWSPDGRKILFMRFGEYGDSHPFVMNADGSGIFPLDTRDDLNYAMDWQPLPG
jgi:Tol biopolymer transport system component